MSVVVFDSWQGVCGRIGPWLFFSTSFAVHGKVVQMSRDARAVKVWSLSESSPLFRSFFHPGRIKGTKSWLKHSVPESAASKLVAVG